MKKLALFMAVIMLLSGPMGWALEESFVTDQKPATEKVLIQFSETTVIQQVSPKMKRRFELTEAKFLEEQDNKLTNIKKDIPNIHIEKQFVTAINGAVVKTDDISIELIKNRPEVLDVIPLVEYSRPIEQMVDADQLTEALFANSELGFTGKGVVVSIIDSGIDYTHKDMRLDGQDVSFSDVYNPTVITDPDYVKLTASNVSDIITSNSLSGKYFTPKVPYGWNFYDNNNHVVDIDEGTSFSADYLDNPSSGSASMHGMHVAGIVGANDDQDDGIYGIEGVAPNVQLLAMKVFSNNQSYSTTSEAYLIEAIEESLILGADVMNISIGQTNSNVNGTSALQQSVNNAAAAGVVMCISAGNSGHFGIDRNSYGSPLSGTALEDMPLAEYQDIGLLGSPGLSDGSMGVASVDNSDEVYQYELVITDTPIEIIPAPASLELIETEIIESPVNPIETDTIGESTVEDPKQEENDSSSLAEPGELIDEDPQTFDEPDPIDEEDPIEEQPIEEEPIEEEPSMDDQTDDSDQNEGEEPDSLEESPIIEEKPENQEPELLSPLEKSSANELIETAEFNDPNIYTIKGYTRMSWASLGDDFNLNFADESTGILATAPDSAEKEVAVISRSLTTSIATLVKDAYDKGYDGVIMYNPQSYMDIPYDYSYDSDDTYIYTPIMYITYESYLLFKDGNKPMTATATVSGTYRDMTVGEMTYYSSWGTTPTMTFKPTIAAPGSTIISTINQISNNSSSYGDADYGSKTGTSMASPQVAGGAALLVEKYNDLYPVAATDSTPANPASPARLQWVKERLMNYSVPVPADNSSSNNPLFLSVRAQGSGCMNVKNALYSNVTIINSNDSKPYVNFGSLDTNTRMFDLTLNNADSSVTYNITPYVVIPSYTDLDGRKALNLGSRDISASLDQSSVTVPNGQSSLNLTLTLNDLSFMSEYKNGTFIEGYLVFEDVDDLVPDMVLPFMSYQGDWDETPVIDGLRGELDSYYDFTGIVDGNSSFSEFPNKAFSPNGDGFNDTVNVAFSVMRNILNLELDIVTEATKEASAVTYIRDYNLIINKQYEPDETFYYFESANRWNGTSAEDGIYYYRFKSELPDYDQEKYAYDFIRFALDTSPPVLDIDTSDIANNNLIITSDDLSGIGLLEMFDSNKNILETKEEEYGLDNLNMTIPSSYEGRFVYLKATDTNQIEGPMEFVPIGGEGAEMVISHQLNQVVDSSTIDFTVYAFDMEVPNLKINWLPYVMTVESDYSVKEYSESGLADGYYTYEVETVDDEMLMHSETIYAMVDTTDPTISNLAFNGTSVGSSYETDSNDITITGTASDNLPIMTIEVDGNEAYTINDGMALDENSYGSHSSNFTINHTISSTQSSVAITVIDVAGNKSNYSIAITRPAYITALYTSPTGTIDLTVGSYRYLTVNARYSDGSLSSIPVSSVSWTYDSSVVSIASNKVTAVGEGITTVTGRYDGKSASFTVEVIEDTYTPPPSGGTGGTGGSSGGGGGSTYTPPVTTNPVTVPVEPILVEDEEVPLGALNFKGAYINGYPDKTFRPNDPLKRSEVSKLFFVSVQIEDGLPLMNFTDVQNHWAIDYIYALNRARLIDGYPDKSFRPESYIKRGEYAKMLAQAMVVLYPDYEGTEIHYTDVADHWSKDYVYKIYSFGIYSDSLASTYRPEDYVTRAEAVVMMNKLLLRSPMATKNSTFIDVPRTFWAHDHIEAASTSVEELTQN